MFVIFLYFFHAIHFVFFDCFVLIVLLPERKKTSPFDFVFLFRSVFFSGFTNYISPYCCTLGKIFSRRHFEMCFLIFPENRI